MKELPLERHLVVSDFHVPDHNLRALELIIKFIGKYKPDKIHLLGDIVNFTAISRYDKDPYDSGTLENEILVGRKVLKKITDAAHKANRKVEVTWYEGNHERRLMKYLGNIASELAHVEILGEKIISVPHLFQLKDFGVDWIDYDTFVKYKGVVFNHGKVVRAKGGYASHAMIDKTGSSGIQGHSHKLAMISRTQLGKMKWWIESGCLCNIPPFPKYVANPDWQKGFTTIDFVGDTAYPKLYAIINDSVVFDKKIIRWND